MKETKEPNNRVSLGDLYYLIVLFLLLYVICASVPTEETSLLKTVNFKTAKKMRNMD